MKDLVLEEILGGHTTTLSGWDRLWPLLVTAALSLVVVLVVQIYVVPHVESRKRRDDRWENDLLRLGETLTFEVNDAASEYLSALYHLAILTRTAADPDRDPERLHEARRQAETRLRDARERYRKTVGRADWLADRVAAAGSGEPEIRRLTLAVAGLSVHDLSDADPTFHGDDFELTEEAVVAVWDMQREVSRNAINQVKVLASGRAPRRRTPLGHLWLRLRRWTRLARQLGRKRTVPPSSARLGPGDEGNAEFDG